MPSRNKNSLLLILSFFLSSWCTAETAYVTFPKKDNATPAKQDVLLRISDKDVAVTEFLTVDTENRNADILAHPAGRRHYFFVLDLINLDINQAVEIRKLVQQSIARIPKEDLIALAAITNEDGLRFFSGLTADRSKITAGFNAMGKVVLSGMVEGPEGNLYPSNFSPVLGTIQPLSDQEFLANLKTYAISKAAREQLAPLYVQAMVDLVSLLSTVPGRKHLILFSAGADVSDLQVNLDQLSGSGSQEAEKKTDTQAEEHKTLDELTELGPRARAEMDAVLRKSTIRDNDASIVSKLMEGVGAHVHVFRPSDQESGFLKDVVQKSRGLYAKISEVPAILDQILSLDKQFYVVGWETVPQKDFHELQPLQVKLQGQETQSPQRWLAPKPLADYTTQEKRIRLSQAMYKDLGKGNSHRFWSDIILDDGFNRISSFTQVTGKHLIEQKASKVDLIFYGFVLEEEGTLLDFSSAPITLDLTNKKLVERLEKSGLKIWNVLFAGQKPVTVRTVVWNTQTGEAVTHSAIIDFGVTELFLTNPFFPSSNFDWILWPAPDQSQTRRGKEIVYPYQVAENIFAPELFPRLQPHEKGRVVYFKVYNFTPGEKYPSVKLSLIGENGDATEIHRFGLMQQPRTIQKNGMEVFWTIESIPPLNKGNYRFQVNVTDSAQNKSVIRDILTLVE